MIFFKTIFKEFYLKKKTFLEENFFQKKNKKVLQKPLKFTPLQKAFCTTAFTKSFVIMKKPLFSKAFLQKAFLENVFYGV